MIILGIDPGKKGGLALLNATTGTIDLAVNMPINAAGMVDVCKVQQLIIENDAHLAYIETQQTRGRQQGNLIIGTNYGRLTAVLELCGVTVVEVSPHEWQKALSLNGDKNEHIQWCENNWHYVPFTSYKKDGTPTAKATRHDGIADAICIAVAGCRIAPF